MNQEKKAKRLLITVACLLGISVCGFIAVMLARKPMLAQDPVVEKTIVEKLGPYQHIQMDESEVTVTEAMVSSALRLRFAEQAEWVEQPVARVGDTVWLTVEWGDSGITQAGVKHTVAASDGFESCRVGDVVTTNRTADEFRLQAADTPTFQVKMMVERIASVNSPTVSEENAQALFGKSLDALTIEIKLEMEAEYAENAESLLTEKKLDKVVAETEFRINSAELELAAGKLTDFVEAEAERRGLSAEEYLALRYGNGNALELAKTRIQRALVAEAILTAEGKLPAETEVVAYAHEKGYSDTDLASADVLTQVTEECRFEAVKTFFLQQ